MDRDTVLEAIKALAVAALPNAKVSRNIDRPTTLPPGGILIIRDGDPGEPERLLSPPMYSYEHRVDLEFAAWPGATEAQLNTMMREFGDAVRADPTLGGACEWAEPVAPVVDTSDGRGTLSFPWADAALLAVYTTSTPL